MTGIDFKKFASPTWKVVVILVLALIEVGCGGAGGDPPKSTTAGAAIASVTPNLGPPGGGTNVTLSGTGFQSGARVLFGGVDASSVVVVSGGQITCRTPAHAAGMVIVEVRNPRGGGSASLSNGFMYEGISLTSSSPGSGPVAGGTQVTLGGTLFGPGTAVTFGGVPATSTAIVSSTQIVATAPAHSAGTVDIKVSNPDGQTATRASAFVYEQLTVASLSANSGPTSGGTPVTVNGTLFQPGAVVTFGGFPSTSTFKSSTQFQVATPAHAATLVQVEVRNPDNQVAALPNAYTYTNVLAVNSVVPSTGPAEGGTAVTITGTSFQAGASVRFGGILAPSANVVSTTQINSVTPSGSGIVAAQVTNPDTQSASLANGFTYDPLRSTTTGPSINNLSPNAGGASGGNTVLIGGANFVSGAIVTFGGVPVSQLSVSSSSQIAAITPAHAPGPVNVVVTNPDGLSATATGAFTYTGLTLAGASPNNGSTFGGLQVTLTGSEFQSGTIVTFGGVNASSVTLVSGIQLLATTPAQSAGIVDVRVVNPNGSAATLVNGFTYEPPPTIAGLSRRVGPTTGGTTVTITGSGFFATPQVFFGTVLSPSVTFLNSSQVRASTPAQAAGVVQVKVRNPDGSEVVIADSFDYQPAASTFYFSSTFEEGNLGRLFGEFVPGCFVPATTTEAAAPGAGGTRSAKMGGSCFLSRLDYLWGRNLAPFNSGSQPPNPALVEANGLWQRFFIMMPQSNIDAVTGAGGEQQKLVLNRYNIDLPNGGWIAIGFGIEFGSFPLNEIRSVSDGFTPFGAYNPATTVLLESGRWYEFQTNFKVDPATCKGRARVWIDGILRTDTGFLAGLGKCGVSDEQALFIGNDVYEGTAPVLVYIDDVSAANGYIQSQPATF